MSLIAGTIITAAHSTTAATSVGLAVTALFAFSFLSPNSFGRFYFPLLFSQSEKKEEVGHFHYLFPNRSVVPSHN